VVPTLLLLSRWIDQINDRFGTIAKWAVLLSCLISALNALVRYLLDYSSNAYLEIQWYLFAACVMLGASQVLRVNEHVRVDVFYGLFSGRGQAIIDLLGFVFFLLPGIAVLLYYAWPLFVNVYVTNEMSSQAGGLIRWPAVLMLPLGFALLLLQGVSEAIKRVAWLLHKYEGDFHYERPLQ
jgi:TRAP-type mannitol/chloroaromatic compound transport system permease small subunit